MPLPFEFPEIVTSTAIVAGALALATILLVVSLRRASHAASGQHEAERRADKAAERAAVAERELREARSVPRGTTDGARRALGDLPAALREIARSGTRRDVAEAVGRAVERLLHPQQWMVFLDMAREGSEYVLVAAGSVSGKTWSVGACLTPQTGLVGLAVRRRAVLDRDDLAAEPPIVRRQVEDSEPRPFLVDVAAPLPGADDAIGAVTVGGSKVPLETARDVLASLAEVAAAALRLLDARELAARLENEDEDTGFAKRSWFTAQASEVLFRDRERGVPMSIAVVGIDHLRLYMNREGAGETRRLLQSVSRLLRPHFSDGDLLCRWAEDEFALLLPGRTKSEACDTLDLIRRQIATQRFHGSRRQPDGAVTLSVGVATSPEDGGRFDDMIDAAYRAFQRARARGGDATTGDVGDAAAEVQAHLERIGSDTSEAVAEVTAFLEETRPRGVVEAEDDIPPAWRV